VQEEVSLIALGVSFVKYTSPLSTEYRMLLRRIVVRTAVVSTFLHGLT
jgi:hypothetical protein